MHMSSSPGASGGTGTGVVRRGAIVISVGSISRNCGFSFLAVLVVAAGATLGCGNGLGSANHASNGGTSGGTGSGGLAGAAGMRDSGGNRATGGTNSNGGATSEDDASGGSQAVSTSVAGLPGRFITWTYNGEPVGLYLPEVTGESMPVLVYLHVCGGYPVNSDHWIISAANAIEPCAVLLPYAPKGPDSNCADWGGTYDANLRRPMIDALHELDRIVQQYGLDTKREYLYGESMGGEGVFRLLVDFPSRFAGAIAVGGYTLDTGAAAMAQTPLWMIQGAADSINLPASIETIYQSILASGGTNVHLTLYPELDHMPSIEQARTDPQFLTWMLTQHRN